MFIRGIRGATVSLDNTKDAIIEATKELLSKLITENNLKTEDIASIFFSVTKDLNAEFPAVAARQLGLSNTPILCLNEIDVPESLGQCIRILCHVNIDVSQSDIKHIYLKEAQSLRPDTVQKNSPYS